MSRFTIVASAALALACAAPLAAQQKAAPLVPKDTSAAAAQAATAASADSASAALARALSELAVSVQKIVAETANKPEVRLAAVQVAGNAVTLAQRTITENVGEIEKLLAQASRQLSAAEVAQKARAEQAEKAAKMAKP